MSAAQLIWCLTGKVLLCPPDSHLLHHVRSYFVDLSRDMCAASAGNPAVLMSLSGVSSAAPRPSVIACMFAWCCANEMK